MNKSTDRTQFYSAIDPLRERLVNKLTSPHEVVHLFADALWPLSINVDSVILSTLVPGTFTAEGTFIHDAEPGENQILITFISAHPTTSIIIKETVWTWLREYIVDIITHEFIHFEQYSKSEDRPLLKKKYSASIKTSRSDAEYLGSPDEMEAFALNIAHELIRSLGSKEEAIYRLRYYSLLNDSHSSTFKEYLNTFETESYIIKRLIQQIVFFIEE